MWAVAIGDCFNGLSFYGPFDGFEAAQDWAASFCGLNHEWNIIPLYKPEGGVRGT